MKKSLLGLILSTLEKTNHSCLYRGEGADFGNRFRSATDRKYFREFHLSQPCARKSAGAPSPSRPRVKSTRYSVICRRMPLSFSGTVTASSCRRRDSLGLIDQL